MALSLRANPPCRAKPVSKLAQRQVKQSEKKSQKESEKESEKKKSQKELENKKGKKKSEKESENEKGKPKKRMSGKHKSRKAAACKHNSGKQKKHGDRFDILKRMQFAPLCLQQLKRHHFSPLDQKFLPDGRYCIECRENGAKLYVTELFVSLD